jgi:glycine/D-amino acid oxidase-like deaminating enzyme
VLSTRDNKGMSDETSFDVAIAGGGAVGASIAYFLKAVEGFAGSVALIERDPSFRHAATTLSAAGIRQQFSTPENIRLSRFGLEFLRGMEARFGREADPAFVEGGYLVLATEDGRENLAANHATQKAEGASVALLGVAALAERFPWLALDGIAAGSLGLSGEGWFDAHTLLRMLRNAVRSAGATLLTGEVTAIETGREHVTGVAFKDGRRIACKFLINAAGPSAGAVAALAGRSLPVEPRKRTVFVIDCPDAPRDLPLVADPSGVWMRPEGRGFIAGWSPPDAEDSVADPTDFEPDHAVFEERLWPALAARIPAFERLKVTGAWAGHYDYNTLDQNAVIGPDPQLPNFFYANGFSGHGIQHAAGVGRALAELIAHGRYRSLDLSVFGYDRIAAGRPHFEQEVI